MDSSIVQSCQFGKGKKSSLDKEGPETNTKVSCSRAFMAGAASQGGDADSSRAPGLTSGLQGSVNVHRGALLLVLQ